MRAELFQVVNRLERGTQEANRTALCRGAHNPTVEHSIDRMWAGKYSRRVGSRLTFSRLGNLLNLSFGCSRSIGTTFEAHIVRRQELPAKIDAVVGEVENSSFVI